VLEPPFADKWRAFGWETLGSMATIFLRWRNFAAPPVLANPRPDCPYHQRPGCMFMEDKLEWHYKSRLMNS
jgi:hypothetical protein